MAKQHTEISKFLSYILRHKPEAIGLTLDHEGWANISDLVECSQKSEYALDTDLIRTIVNESDKKRFTISEDGLRIRAAQGHSAKSVSISYSESMPPEVLFHGTATRFLASILKEGLKPGERQYVHLSKDIQTALAVGRRYGKPVALKIKALQMHLQGFKFFQAENGVWLTAKAPAIFIEQHLEE